MSDRNLRIQVLLAAIDKATTPFRTITKASGATGKAFKETREQLKALDRVQRDLDGFRKLEGEIVSSNLELKKARETTAALARQFAAAEAPSKRLTNQFTRAREAVIRLEAKQRDEVRQLGELKTKLDAAGMASKGFAGMQEHVRRETAAANQQLDKQKSKLAQLGERQARMTKAQEIGSKYQAGAGRAVAVGVGAAGGAAGIAMLGKQGLDEANEYESRMTDIGQKADLTRAQAAAMGRQIRSIAREVNVLPAQVQDTVDTMAGFGMTPQQALALAKPLGRFQKAYKAEALDVSAMAFAMTDNLKVSNAELSKALDGAAYTSKRGAVEPKDMAAGMPSLTAQYQAMGQTGVRASNDLAASLQIVRKGSSNSTEAVTNLENVLQKIGSPQTRKAFAKMGVDLEKEMKRAAKAGKTPIQAIADITNEALKGDLSKLGNLYEDAQVQKGIRPLIIFRDLQREIAAGANAASGVVDADFAERLNDSAEKTIALKNAVSDLKIEVGGGLQPVLNPIIDKIALATRNFSAWTQEHPKLSAGLAKVGVVVGVLLAVIAGIALFVAPILLFIGALGAAAAALGTTIGAVALTIVGVIALIGVLTLAIIGVIKGWARYSPAIAAWISNLLKQFGAWIGHMLNFHENMKAAGLHIIMGLAKGIWSGLDPVKKAISGVGAKMIGWFKEKLGIRSPSRVFAGLGGFLMSGLEQGIVGGEQGPLRRVARVAGGMAAAFGVASAQMAMAQPAISVAERGAARLDARGSIRPIASGPSSGAAAAGGPSMMFTGPITIELSLPAGADQNQAARMLRGAFQQLMREHQAGAAASARSAYRDQED